MTNEYPPVNPPNPADLMVSAGSPRPGTLRDSLQAYADRLAAVDAFADVTARDTRIVTATIAWDVLQGDQSTALRRRAAAVTAGEWSGWDHPAGVARAFTIAAIVLDAL